MQTRCYYHDVQVSRSKYAIGIVTPSYARCGTLLVLIHLRIAGATPIQYLWLEYLLKKCTFISHYLYNHCVHEYK